mmetsp:Transcript_21953/g.60996  ORF Transcript_21953/g.60996 Transcript_21953/m.60996 type:complete len:1287 (+) Transcript_21953:202-4062(+)|eukprot:CAMPEP_0172363408 /NCGR_PEP_ID=MMETSP1060-20121228/6778_1 /TAXON_ID=37318 /ORGANISM="Pseudo-nitzschia pungens, Strain cf. cingulata" /LENGTH=1286 /DNA_ID=CAMNT_0013086143 /DNA_START=146 /DNA_END=4006 /DNA_ORIENTATION=-
MEGQSERDTVESYKNGKHGYLTDRDPREFPEKEEPSEEKANSLPFAEFLCFRLEKLWKNKREKQASRRWKEKQKLDYILPRDMIDDLNGQTIFPYLRLILPEQDSRRQFHVKEKKIADAYCKALSLAGTKYNEMLMNFTDPQIAPPNIAGDLSLVIEHVLESVRSKKRHSDLTVGKINCLLDEFANLKAYHNQNINSNRGTAHHNHEWRESLHRDKNVVEKQKDGTLRSNWLKRVIDMGLSPSEHKWLVRILQKKMEMGLGYVTVLKHMSPYATELWNAHNNLQKICTILADPAYVDHRRKKEALQSKGQGSSSTWEPQVQPAELGNTLSPMISIRSSFEKLMSQTQTHHEEYLKKNYPSSGKTHRPLSIQFPALTAEIKLDGERMIVHINNGRVKMNTRNGKWYTELYTPVLGAPLRRSLTKYSNANVILDGEIESWDNLKKSLVPFGENRTVAAYRRAYLSHNGMIDPIDTEELHDKNDDTVMRAAKDFYRDRSISREDMIDRGSNFWLKFRVFDILHVAGNDKDRLFEDCGMGPDERDKNGSIIHMPLMKRKQILYQILTVQENEVEICPTVVIRCNGEAVLGEEYFSTTNQITEFGYPVTVLDSTQAIFQQRLENLESLDMRRKLGRSDNEISKMRAEAMEIFYTKVVEEYKFEGLVVKDLASPYLFGSRKFWWKFKPDYETDEAVDIDAVIIGATFATGLRNNGTPSAFLLGVVDKFDETCFMTLNTINAGSTSRDNMGEILKHTGFRKGGDEPMELGKWFREDNFELPGFISKRSFQRNSTEDLQGWAFNKTKHYPDIWIDPNDSVVLTVKGAELVVSDEYSVGLTLRFPRIKKVRLQSVHGDEKKATETTTDDEIWKIFDEARSRRFDADSIIGSHRRPGDGTIPVRRGCRFLTPAEYRIKTKKRKHKEISSPSIKVPKVTDYKSHVLDGLSFCVLEGVYSFDVNSLDGQVALQEGWAHEAKNVKTEKDVIRFIIEHGGNYKAEVVGATKEYIIGGNEGDARVKQQMIGLARAKSLIDSKKKADRPLVSVAKHHDGIIKWTFVYSLVHRLQQSSDKNEGDKNLTPDQHQYLDRVPTNFRKESNAEALFSLNRRMEVNEMEHVLKTDGIVKVPPWQLKGLIDLPKEERWVLSSRYTSLWPYKDDTETSYERKAVVLYPDIFRRGYGFVEEKDAVDEALALTESTRWNQIANQLDEITSVLPLVSIMGGLTTPHLHTGVTHIICLMRDDSEHPYEDAMSLDIFVCKERGHRLMQYLRQNFLHRNELKLVSPNWIRNMFVLD